MASLEEADDRADRIHGDLAHDLAIPPEHASVAADDQLRDRMAPTQGGSTKVASSIQRAPRRRPIAAKTAVARAVMLSSIVVMQNTSPLRLGLGDRLAG